MYTETAAIMPMRHSLMGVADALAISRNDVAQYETKPAWRIYSQQHWYPGGRRYFRPLPVPVTR